MGDLATQGGLGNFGPVKSGRGSLRTYRRNPSVVLSIVAGIFLFACSFLTPVTAATRGGVVVAHRAGARRIRLIAKPPLIVRFDTGFPAFEPTIGITKHGDILYSSWSPGVGDDGPAVIRSRNGGRTWEDVSQRVLGHKTHTSSGDPYLYLDADTGRAFNVDLQAACAMLSYSDDLGASWTSNPLGCGGPAPDHQTLFSGIPVSSLTVGYAKVIYYCWNEAVALAVCAKSLDGGVTFVRTGAPAFGPNPPCGGVTGHGIADSHGAIYLPKVVCTSGATTVDREGNLRFDGEPWLAVSHDEGLTWTTVRVSSMTGVVHEAGVAVDRAGTVYYDWIDARTKLPFLVVSRDGGRTWGKPLMIAPPGVSEAALPGIDAGAPGKIAVVYMARLGHSSGWNGYMTVSANATAKDPVFYSGSVNSSLAPMETQHCEARCPTIGDFFDVVIGPDGTPWSAFAQGCNGPCGGSWPFHSYARGIVGHMTGAPRLR